MTLITTPCWWEQGTAFPAFETEPAQQCELAIIGGGFTGLSAAITAARKGAEVAVFDAALPGQGASTRNGGMIGAPHRPGLLNELKTYGEELARALVREGVEAYHFTRELYTNGTIDAGFNQTGRIQLANTKAHFEAMKQRARLLNAIDDQNIEIVERAELKNHIQSDLYFGALFYPDHGGIHPRKAHDGLLQLARQNGVKIYQNCPVLSIKRIENGFELDINQKKTCANRLIIATNGYTKSKPMRWLARRTFRIPSFLIATSELPPGVIDRLAPGHHMMVESRAKHSYFRPSPDGRRIIFGGRAALVSLDPQTAASRLHQTLASIWPEASDWEITHCWQGFTGFTFSGIPHVGTHEGIHYALGYCGNGLALSPWLGHKVALRALEGGFEGGIGAAGGHRPKKKNRESETAFSQTRFESRPYHAGGAPWFMGLASPWWRHVVDKNEEKATARDRQTP